MRTTRPPSSARTSGLSPISAEASARPYPPIAACRTGSTTIPTSLRSGRARRSRPRAAGGRASLPVKRQSITRDAGERPRARDQIAGADALVDLPVDRAQCRVLAEVRIERRRVDSLHDLAGVDARHRLRHDGGALGVKLLLDRREPERLRAGDRAGADAEGHDGLDEQ